MRMYAIVVAILAIISFLTYIMHTKSKLEADLLECRIKSEQLISAIEFQNAEIQRQALDTETYKEKQKELEKEVANKYKVADSMKTDSTCEQDLKNIREVMQIYYKGAM